MVLYRKCFGTYRSIFSICCRHFDRASSPRLGGWRDCGNRSQRNGASADWASGMANSARLLPVYGSTVESCYQHDVDGENDAGKYSFSSIPWRLVLHSMGDRHASVCWVHSRFLVVATTNSLRRCSLPVCSKEICSEQLSRSIVASEYRAARVPPRH